MCMLYGFSAEGMNNLTVTLKEFYLKSNKHPDGWGLGRYIESNPVINKGAKASEISESLSTEKVHSSLCVAHIRKATRGAVTIKNAHPFSANQNGKSWIFAHNGTIDKEAFEDVRLKGLQGDTDSEKAFRFMMSRLVFQKDELASIEHSVRYLASYGKFNMVMADGERLYVHTNKKATLYQYKAESGVLFCTEPLKKVKRPLAWKAVPMNRLLVYENGKLIYEGAKHAFES